MDLRNIKLFLLDMDGTIYLDDDLFDGSLDFLNKLDVKPQKVAIFSGTSAPSNLIHEIYEILKQL